MPKKLIVKPKAKAPAKPKKEKKVMTAEEKKEIKVKKAKKKKEDSFLKLGDDRAVEKRAKAIKKQKKEYVPKKGEISKRVYDARAKKYGNSFGVLPSTKPSVRDGDYMIDYRRGDDFPVRILKPKKKKKLVLKKKV